MHVFISIDISNNDSNKDDNNVSEIKVIMINDIT